MASSIVHPRWMHVSNTFLSMDVLNQFKSLMLGIFNMLALKSQICCDHNFRFYLNLRS